LNDRGRWRDGNGSAQGTVVGRAGPQRPEAAPGSRLQWHRMVTEMGKFDQQAKE
jgi:hypothetical protein